jgi:hypothetical protein
MFIDIKMTLLWFRSKEQKTTRFFNIQESLRSFERSRCVGCAVFYKHLAPPG